MEEEKKVVYRKGYFEHNGKYDGPKIEERIVELRDEGKNWEDITTIVRKEIDEPKMQRAMTKNIYNRAMAKTITTERIAGRKFKDYTTELDKMYGKSISVLENYIKAAEGVAEELQKMVDDGNIEAVKAYGIILKTAPQMKAITSEIRDFMKLQQDQQEKIKIEQTALVWDESQMIDYLNTYLKRLQKEGTIKILKPTI